MAGESIKKYVGAAGDAIALMWQKLRSQGTTSEAEPPVGSQDKVGGRTTPAATAVGGISTGMLLLAAAVFFMMKRRR